MDRTEFSQKLYEIRNSEGVSTMDMMLSLKVLDSQIRRIEKAKNNFSLSRSISYLDAIGYHIEVEGRNSYLILYDSPEAVEWFKSIKGEVSMSKLAPELGITQSALSLILSGKNSLSIDVFLAICNYYNAEIKFIKNEQDDES